MDQLIDLTTGGNLSLAVAIYSWPVVILNCLLSGLLGLGIAVVYKHTHQGLSYSRSFVVMLVLVTIVSGLAMMIIGNNIARAFALVGALSIIRFRTVIKDTRDIAFIFTALVAGMASGTSSYFIGMFGTAFVLAVVILLDMREFGSLLKKEFIIRLDAERSMAEEIIRTGKRFVDSMTILEIEGSPGSSELIQLTYDVVLKADADIEMFAREVRDLEGVKNIRFIATRQDVDY